MAAQRHTFSPAFSLRSEALAAQSALLSLAARWRQFEEPDWAGEAEAAAKTIGFHAQAAQRQVEACDGKGRMPDHQAEGGQG